MIEAFLAYAYFRCGFSLEEVLGCDAYSGTDVRVKVVEVRGEPVEFDAFDFDTWVGELVVGIGR